MTESSLSSIDQAQIVRICLPEQASAKEPEHAHNGGSRAMGRTSDHHVARPMFQSVREPSADSERLNIQLRGLRLMGHICQFWTPPRLPVIRGGATRRAYRE
jgi:hypothetical protein